MVETVLIMHLNYLKKLITRNFQAGSVFTNKQMMSHASRLQLLHFLFGISAADGHVHSKEIETIKIIANYLGISLNDFESIKAMLFLIKFQPTKY